MDHSSDQLVDKVTSAANGNCQLACTRAKELVKNNPIPTVLGALVFGAAAGYILLSKRDASFYDRLVRDSLSTRRRLASAPGRLSSIFHEGYDAASRSAGKASDFFHDLPTDDVVHSVSHSINRLRNRLKFW